MRAIGTSRRRHSPTASSGQEQDRVIVPARRRRGATALRIGHPVCGASSRFYLVLERVLPECLPHLDSGAWLPTGKINP